MKKFVCSIFCTIILVLVCYTGVYADSVRYIIKFTDGYTPDTLIWNLEELDPQRGFYITEDLRVAEELRDYVEYTQQDVAVELVPSIGFEESEFSEIAGVSLMSVDEPSWQKQWNLRTLNIPYAWDLQTYGNDIKVAVIDSGCATHPDLKDNLLTGKNYYTGTTDVTDNIGHGTHVTGIIAASVNGVGITGAAPKAKIVPLKCFEADRSTYVSTLATAIREAVDVYGCKVINMSWSMTANNSYLRDAVNYAHSKGVFLVAAVGNSGNAEKEKDRIALHYPAAYSAVIGVGSVTSSLEKSDFSQYNSSVHVVAPGSSIYSTYCSANGFTYATASGTSQATPHVSAMAAIALSANPELTPDEFADILANTAKDLGDEGRDNLYGHGLVNFPEVFENVIEDMDWYISPLNGNQILVRNNTSLPKNALAIWTQYDSEGYVGATLTSSELQSKESIVAHHPDTDNRFRFYLWDSLSSLRPYDIKNIEH